MVLRLLRYLLGGVFFLFGVWKLEDPKAFVENVSNFQIAPFDAAPWDMYLAYLLPPLEVICGLCLITGYAVRGALVLSVLMTLSFMGAIAWVWQLGLNIDCGCTGGEVSLGGYPAHMAALTVMLAIGVYLIIDTLFPSCEKSD